MLQAVRQGIQVLIWLWRRRYCWLRHLQSANMSGEPSLATELVPMPPEDGLPLEVLLSHTSASSLQPFNRVSVAAMLARALYRQYFAAHGRPTSMETVDLPAELIASPHLCVGLRS